MRRDKERRVDKGLKWRLARMASRTLSAEERELLAKDIAILQSDLKNDEERRVDGMLARL